jgi:D-sedoheptulose 7-phosphate isomerase
MNTFERIFESSSSIQEFSKKYFSCIFELLNRIDLTSIGLFAERLEKARKNQNTVFFIGNGGSAATASHMVNDFGTGVCKKTKTDLPLRVLSLTDNNAMMLAIANDDGYENLFVNQLQIYHKQGDILVAISASGNSPNVVAAAEWVKKQGGTVMAFVGFDGGKLKEISDVVIHVKSMKEEYGPVEDAHLIMGHLLSYWLQYQIEKGKNMEKEL